MTTFRSRVFLFAAALLFSSLMGLTGARAGEADIVGAVVTRLNGDSFRFDVSVLHEDTGWDHYANAFEILDSNGNILGTRVLLHPHVGQLPFTRSLTLTLSPAIRQVTIRGVDSVHGRGGKEMNVDIPWQ